MQWATAKDAERRQLRAYIGIGADAGGIGYEADTGKYSFRFKMQNYGLTPAYKVTYAARIDILPYPPPYKSIVDQFPIDIAAAREQFEVTINPASFTWGNVESDSSVTLNQLKEVLLARDRKIYSWGVIEYYDAFGFRNTTTFCESYTTTTQMTAKMKIGLSVTSGIVGQSCPHDDNAN